MTGQQADISFYKREAERLAMLAVENKQKALRDDDPALLDEAEEQLRFATILSGGEYYLYAMLGEVLIHNSKSAEAIPHLQKAIDLNPDSASCKRRLISALCDEERYREAFDLAAQCTKAHPDDYDFWIRAAATFNMAAAEGADNDDYDEDAVAEKAALYIKEAFDRLPAAAEMSDPFKTSPEDVLKLWDEAQEALALRNFPGASVTDSHLPSLDQR